MSCTKTQGGHPGTRPDAALKNAVSAAGQKAQYDRQVKKLLGHKYVLAYILIHTVDEFKGMRPGDVAELIDGEPLIGVVPVEPGLTNAEETDARMSGFKADGGGGAADNPAGTSGKRRRGMRAAGFNTEQGEPGEGRVYFDIVFYVRMRDGLSQIIINVEAQKDDPKDYKVLNRAIFYVARLVSSQKERDFIGMNYDDLKRVYSIFICMNMKENCMDYVHLTKEHLLGAHDWKGKLNLLNIVLIGLSDKLPDHDEKYELHRLLGTLLSARMPEKDRLEIIGREYEFPEDESIRKDVRAVCNLSEGVWEQGVQQGKDATLLEIIRNMQRKGFSLEQIADATDKSVREVQSIIEKAFAPV